MNSSFKNIIPENFVGKPSDIEHRITLDSREEALDVFTRAAKRMLNVNIWRQLGGLISAEFVLTDKTGQKLEKLAAQGDFIKIDIQGPGPSSGDGFDWVNIEAVQDFSVMDAEAERIAMRVRSCQQPGKDGGHIAHFFKGDATSTFIIYRNQNTITSFYHGRNEVLNSSTGDMLDNIRNTIMGGVALAGVSEIQWNTLIRSFLEREV